MTSGPNSTDIDLVKKTIFHGGWHYLERLNEIFKSLDWASLSREGNENPIDGWRNNYLLLNVLFKEVYPKIHPTIRAELVQQKKDLRKSLNIAIYNLKQGKKVSLDFFEDFDDFEMMLRQIIEDKGLLMPDKGSWEEATEL